MATRNRNGWFGGSARAKATENDLMERQNNEHLDTLSEQVAMLKSLTMEIDAEVKDQNSFLENMGISFVGAGEALGGTMQALESMSKRAGPKLAVLIIFGIIGLFLFIWKITSRVSPEST